MENKALSKQTGSRASLFGNGWMEKFLNAPLYDGELSISIPRTAARQTKNIKQIAVN